MEMPLLWLAGWLFTDEKAASKQRYVCLEAWKILYIKQHESYERSRRRRWSPQGEVGDNTKMDRALP